MVINIILHNTGPLEYFARGTHDDLISPLKLEAKENFCTAALSILYKLQNPYFKKSCVLFNYYHTSFQEYCEHGKKASGSKMTVNYLKSFSRRALLHPFR
jgi:hypothetical protein